MFSRLQNVLPLSKRIIKDSRFMNFSNLRLLSSIILIGFFFAFLHLRVELTRSKYNEFKHAALHSRSMHWLHDCHYTIGQAPKITLADWSIPWTRPHLNPHVFVFIRQAHTPSVIIMFHHIRHNKVVEKRILHHKIRANTDLLMSESEIATIVMETLLPLSPPSTPPSADSVSTFSYSFSESAMP